MAPRNPYAAYADNKIYTASQEELTLMLFDGNVRFCKIALEAMKNKEIEKAHRNIIKVENILLELQMTLDRKYPISKDLDEMYQLVYDKLVYANMKQDVNVLTDCLDLLIGLRDMWKDAMKEAKVQRAAAIAKNPNKSVSASI